MAQFNRLTPLKMKIVHFDMKIENFQMGEYLAWMLGLTKNQGFTMLSTLNNSKMKLKKYFFQHLYNIE